MQLVYEDMPQESGSYQCRAAHISANRYANGYRYGDEYGYGYWSQVCINAGLEASRDQSINKSF
jgi:predicted nucleic acid-binding protein